jgi:hypothetical protein
MGKAIIIAMLLLNEGGGSPMGQVLSDSLFIFGFLAIVLAPMAFALAETGPGGAASKLLTFLCWYLRRMVLYFNLKSTSRACSLGPGVGMRDGHATEPQSTSCVIRASPMVRMACRPTIAMGNFVPTVSRDRRWLIVR